VKRVLRSSLAQGKLPSLYRNGRTLGARKLLGKKRFASRKNVKRGEKQQGALDPRKKHHPLTPKGCGGKSHQIGKLP